MRRFCVRRGVTAPNPLIFVGAHHATRLALGTERVARSSRHGFDERWRKENAMGESSTAVEARAWLLSNSNSSALATNKFENTDRALAFVDELYAAGATEVLIDNISEEHRAREGGPYADSLIIRVGGDSSVRHSILKICEQAIEGEADGRVDHYRDEIHVWWD
jgi:hypothetical protein